MAMGYWSQGWGYSDSPTRHFFRQGHARCNRRIVANGELEASDVPEGGDCVKCRRLHGRDTGVAQAVREHLTKRRAAS